MYVCMYVCMYMYTYTYTYIYTCIYICTCMSSKLMGCLVNLIPHPLGASDTGLIIIPPTP